MANTIEKGKSKNKRESASDEMDDFNFEDLDGMSFDDELGSDDRKPTPAGIGKEFLSGAKDGFKSDIIKNMAKKSLPEEFETYSSELTDLSYFATDTLDKSKSKLKKPISRIAKETKKFLPEGLTTLNKWVDKIIENTDEQKTQQVNEEEVRTVQITGALGNIFDKQLEVQKALAARSEVAADVDRKININSVKKTQDLLNDISASSSTTTSFNIQIAKEYYKKSLELQFRSYYIQADTLKSIKEYYPIYKTQFDAIVKNSGLPDYVKIRTGEKYFDIARTQMMQGLNDKLMNNNKFMQNVKKNLSNMVDSKVSDLAEKMDTVAEAMSGLNDYTSMDESKSKATALAGLAGSLGGSELAKWIAGKFGDKIKPYMEKSTIANTAKDSLAVLGTSPQVALATAKEKMEGWQRGFEDNEGGGKGFWNGAKNMLGKAGTSIALGGLEATNQSREDMEVNKENILTAKTSAVFDQQFYRSVTHVIPLYLAHILRENKRVADVTAPDNKGEVMEYDYNSRKLDSKSNIQSNYGSFLEKKAVGDKSKNVASSVIGTLDLNTGEKKELTKAMEEYLNKAKNLLDSKDLTYDNLFGTTTNEAIQKLRNGSEVNKKMFEKIAKFEKKNAVNKERLKNAGKDIVGSNANKEIQALFALVLELAKKLHLPIPKVVKSFSMSEEELLAINNSVMKFIAEDNGVLTAERLPDAFNYIDSNEESLLATKVIIMLSIVKAIIERMETKGVYGMQITRVLGAIHTKIISNIKIDPNVLRTIHGLNPGAIDMKTASADALINLKLNGGSKEEAKSNFRGMLGGKNTVKIKDKMVEHLIIKSTESELLDLGRDVANKIYANSVDAYNKAKGAIDKAVDIKNQLKAANGDTDKQARILKEALDGIGNVIYDTAKELKNKTEKGLSELSKIGAKFTNEAKDSIVTKLAENIANIEQLIASRKEAIEKLSAAESRINSNLSETFEANFNVESVNKKFIETEIKALETTAKHLGNLKTAMTQLDFTDVNKENIRKQYNKLKAAAIEAYNKLNDLSKQFNKAREEALEAETKRQEQLARDIATATSSQASTVTV